MKECFNLFRKLTNYKYKLKKLVYDNYSWKNYRFPSILRFGNFLKAKYGGVLAVGIKYFDADSMSK